MRDRLARHRQRALAGDFGRRRVFRYVARFEPSHHDFADACRCKRGDFGLADQRTLLEDKTGLADRMHRDGAFGFRNRHRPKLHATSSRAFFWPWRSLAVTSPMMEIAISGGDTAPMSRPIGAWMRASAASPEALLFQPFETAAVRFSGTECADVEAVTSECVQERRIVDLRIVRQRDERGVAIDAAVAAMRCPAIRRSPSRRGTARAMQRPCAGRRW